VGVASSLRRLGWLIPQLLTAVYAERFPRRKPLVVASMLVQRVAWLLMGMLAVVVEAPVAVWLFLPLYAIGCLAEGVSSAPWSDMLGRSVPAERRGRLLGLMTAAGGMLAFGAGLVVRKVLLVSSGSPAGFGLLFLVGTALSLPSVWAVWLIREPLAPNCRPEEPLGTTLLRVPELLRRPEVRNILWVRALASTIHLSLPFYAVYATRGLGFGPQEAGLFVSVQMAGSTLGSLFWGWLAGRRESRVLVTAVCATAAALPFTAVLFGRLWTWTAVDAFRWGYLAVFFLLGMVMAGMWMGFLHYVLDIAPADRQPTYVGLLNTLVAPLTLLSVVGGWFLRYGYALLFLVNAVFLLWAVARCRHLTAGRRPRPVAEPAGDTAQDG